MYLDIAISGASQLFYQFIVILQHYLAIRTLNLLFTNSGREELLTGLKAYVPRNADIEHVRILLDGPVGAGKSSFINSINNIFQNKTTSKALADSAMADQSFTITVSYFAHIIYIQRSNQRYNK